MLDVLTWLRGTLEGDAQAARAALDEGHHWIRGVEASDWGLAAIWETAGLDEPDRCSEHDPGIPNLCDDALMAVVDDFHGLKAHAKAAHIALHDPQATIARCEAELALIDRLEAAMNDPINYDFAARNLAEDGIATLSFGYRHRPGWQAGWAP